MTEKKGEKSNILPQKRRKIGYPDSEIFQNQPLVGVLPKKQAKRAASLLIQLTAERPQLFRNLSFNYFSFRHRNIQRREEDIMHSCFEVKYLTVSLPSYWCCFVPRGIEISGLLKVGRKMAWSFYSHSVHFSALQRKLRENKMNSSFTLYELKYIHIKFVLLS